MPPGHIGDMNIADQIAVVTYCLDDVSLFNLRVIDIQQQPYPGAPDFLNQTNRVLDSRQRVARVIDLGIHVFEEIDDVMFFG